MEYQVLLMALNLELQLITLIMLLINLVSLILMVYMSKVNCNGSLRDIHIFAKPTVFPPLLML